ncbi:fdxN element excision controlling factor protein [Nostoc sp. NIES-3756]|uniref:XisI protein n=1 Tax=Nostoc sp. NIES-3756 TaxID=1751286 RepID=UPI00072026E4|nr:XisI protein [Nostoc sp. NIES-3756]BAT52676.1 fdxN element excision controlling factor protein [Nostoc sp. NIES-3756]BAY39635.1 fdxN element excision controlling factor protein [Nostoc sp. NIES-2111]
MDKLDNYRQYIKQLLKLYSQYSKSDTEVEAQTIFDSENDHYQLVYVGWKNQRRVYGCVLHLDIKNEKIWIQHNGTEANIADELVDLGVPKQDIVLGFHSPYKRQFTDFAVG